MKKNILIVDFCTDTIETLKELLHHKIFDITVAGNEEVAKALLKKNTFDMVITETLLPKSHGFILCQYVTENYPDTKVIVMSEKLKKMDYKRDAVNKYGACDFFEKPLDTLKVKKRIYKCLGIKDAFLVALGDTDALSTNIHILPSLEEIEAEKRKREGKDSFTDILDDIEKDNEYQIDLD